jgi:uncharacterized membrane protein
MLVCFYLQMNQKEVAFSFQNHVVHDKSVLFLLNNFISLEDTKKFLERHFDSTCLMEHLQ